MRLGRFVPEDVASLEGRLEGDPRKSRRNCATASSDEVPVRLILVSMRKSGCSKQKLRAQGGREMATSHCFNSFGD